MVHRESSFSVSQTIPAASKAGSATRGCVRRRSGFVQVSIPYLDPTVQHVGISKLRALNATQLRDLDKTLVIQENDKPLAVLLKYEHFMAMQEQIRSIE